MPNEVVTKDDLHDVRDMLAEQVKEGLGALSVQTQQGLAGINSRLDVLNGRVGKGEVADAVTDQRLGHVDSRLGHVEKEVFNRRRTDHPDQIVAPPTPPDDQIAISRRDLKVAVAVICAMYVIAQVAMKVVPFLANAVKP